MTKWIVHGIIFLIVAGVVTATFLNTDPKDDTSAVFQLPALMLAGVYAGILFIMYILPAITDKATQMVFDSGEMVEDEKAVDPSLTLENRNLHGELDELLESLDEREAHIIDHRFGLNGKKPLTLEEISRDFGVSRERIRQVQNIALAKMKKILGQKDEPMPESMKPHQA